MGRACRVCRAEGVLVEMFYYCHPVCSHPGRTRGLLASAFSDTGSAQQCCLLVLGKSQGAAGPDDGGHGEQGVAM